MQPQLSKEVKRSKMLGKLNSPNLRTLVKDLIEAGNLDQIDAVFGKNSGYSYDQEIELFIWIPEHSDAAFEQLNQLEDGLRKTYPNVDTTAWAHQGRDYSSPPYSYRCACFIR